MCTIGAVYGGKELILFKNCDMVKKGKFYRPKKRKGKYEYLAFTRKGRPGLWAGINEYGLGIVAADTYTKKEYKAKKSVVDEIFRGYEKAIADFKTTDEAVKFLKKFYKSRIKIVPDLLILADRKKATAFEFTPPNKFGLKSVSKGFVLRTNQFKILGGGKNRKEDPESHIRFANALALLKKDSSVKGIERLCRNHRSGPGKCSVCRHGKKGGYKSQASAIMVAGKGVKAHYIINGFPCKQDYVETILY